MNKFILNTVTKFLISWSVLFIIYADSFAGGDKTVATKTTAHKVALNLDVEQLNRSTKLYDRSSKTSRLRKILSNETRRKHFKFVVSKLAEFKLPKELALIPIIESEYSTKAVSPKGAGGMWQLMPGTAKILGISNKQRFELAPSTKAALLYFRDLHHEYGNLDLVVAAYNAGSARVDKALKQNPKAKSVQQLNLPRETRNYVRSFNHLQNEFKTYQS